jgi:histone deacetylase 1/2
MRQPDSREFLRAVKEEFQGMLDNHVLSFIELIRVPKGTVIFPAVWAMKRKRRVKTREVYKWKARLAFDGSRQVEGVHYDQTYAPVASWETIRLLLAMVLRNGWKTRQLDYVLAFPQAPAERELYMKIPKGIKVETEDEYVLRVDRNLYGQKQAGRVWNLHLVRKLIQIGFVQSTEDECLFYKGNVMYALYTDDSILAGPDDAELDRVIEEIAAAGLDITEEEGGLEDFLGVNIERTPEGGFHLSQPQLIEQILNDLNLLGENVKIRDTPALSTTVLSAFPESEKHDQHFHYRSVIGKLNYLEKCTRPDIAYAVHQCARFSQDPKVEHAKAVKLIGRYLRGNRNKGIYLRPTDDSFTVWADADFSGNWKKDDDESVHDNSTARSRSGYIISYLGCPILWKSQLQTEIALSSTESEYISLSQALRKTIPLMKTVQEMKERGYGVGQTIPVVHCKLFEDNAGALCLAKAPAMRPRTKHINVKYHHFRSAVAAGLVTILDIHTDDQLADMLTKANPVNVLQRHRLRLMGW